MRDDCAVDNARVHVAIICFRPWRHRKAGPTGLVVPPTKEIVELVVEPEWKCSFGIVAQTGQVMPTGVECARDARLDAIATCDAAVSDQYNEWRADIGARHACCRVTKCKMYCRVTTAVRIEDVKDRSG